LEAKFKYKKVAYTYGGLQLMLKYLPVFTAFLLLLSSTHAVAQEGPGKTEGNAIEADGLKSAASLSINGTKFDDSNKNAIFDAVERGLSGWIIRLKLDDREISNTTTNESGFYAFTNLGPGNYTVIEDQQAGWKQSAPDIRGYTINLSDKSVYRVDFGNFRVPKASSGLSRISDEYGVNAKDVPEDAVARREFTAMPVDSEWIEEERKIYESLPKARVGLKSDAGTDMELGRGSNMR
jgi:hypothetical protein